MGAIKSNNYTQREQDLFLIARAFAHPARIRIMKMLHSGMGLRNVDLSVELNLSKKTIKEHVDMIKDAKLIRIDYFMHYYLISLNSDGLEKAAYILKME